GITHYGNFDVRNSYNWYKFMRKWCGFEMKELHPAYREEMMQREEVQNMPLYPDDVYIIIIDDVIVIKF
ncbi:MAG: hypothetical protein IJZ96_10230, partial [Lachnospiraceae bacterium]|nr:hypothetical protein [Lachnospiraceae bacterium]